MLLDQLGFYPHAHELPKIPEYTSHYLSAYYPLIIQSIIKYFHLNSSFSISIWLKITTFFSQLKPIAIQSILHEENASILISNPVHEVAIFTWFEGAIYIKLTLAHNEHSPSYALSSLLLAFSLD
jgi:hypothetical protein